MLSKIKRSSGLGFILLTSFCLGYLVGALFESNAVQADPYEEYIPVESDEPIVEDTEVIDYEVDTAESPTTFEEIQDPAFKIALQRAKEFEGFSDTPYLLYGEWHIGYGHNIPSPEYYPILSREGAEELLLSDMSNVEAELVRTLGFYGDLPLAARIVLLDMGYNMGVPRLRGFTYMLHAMSVNDWTTAAHEMIDSLYYEQVTRRASNNVMLILDLVGHGAREGVQL